MIPVAALPDPIIFAHRGGTEFGPENSWLSLQSLEDLGVTHLETDVQLTADGQVVLCHDDTLERMFGTEGKVSDYTYEELREFQNEAGEAPALLSDVLVAFPDLYLNIDAKTNEVAQPLVKVLIEHGALDRVLVASFSERRLEKLRQEYGPELSTSLGVKAVVNLLMAAETVSSAKTWRVPGPSQGARAVQVPVKTKGIRVITPRFVATAHAAGLAVHAWTVNDPEEMRNLVEMGVDGIVTDVPSVAVEVFKEMGFDSTDRAVANEAPNDSGIGLSGFSDGDFGEGDSDNHPA